MLPALITMNNEHKNDTKNAGSAENHGKDYSTNNTAKHENIQMDAQLRIHAKVNGI